MLKELRSQGVTGETIRVVDYDIRPGVGADMGEGDRWPQILKRIKQADVLVLATPTWVGHMSSVAQRVLDGAHKIIADTFQGLNDIGFTLAAQGGTYWNHEAMNPKDYKDLDQTPQAVIATNRTAVANAVHLARQLTRSQYPGS